MSRPSSNVESVLVEATAWREAVAEVRAWSPIDVFPEDGTSLDSASARFARGLCDAIVERAERKMADLALPARELMGDANRRLRGGG